MSRIKKIALLLVLIGLGGGVFFSFFPHRGQAPIQKESRFIMGTICTIQAPGPLAPQEVIARAFARLEECDRKFSIFIPSNPVARFNRSGQAIDDPEVVALIAKACEVSSLTEGAFDITVYPLLELWGFYGEKPRRPRREEIELAQKKVGWQNLVIANGQVTKKNAEVQIDLGAIAKGYAVDEARKVLLASGVSNALINVGGDIYALGKRNQQLWKIGIRHPRRAGILQVVELSDQAVSTSGDYEQCFFENGVRYHHIFDPRTGYPATNLMSVTVIENDATLADAYATAVFVLGEEGEGQLVAAGSKAKVLMVTSSGQLILSDGWKGAPSLRLGDGRSR